ncbi:hypothetical protein C8Q72DRAFT_799368 [Fomitopsis betulina]|nr:hypothetical protein C8Q72DRAFT_799368 [Fomitopsis betulina]
MQFSVGHGHHTVHPPRQPALALGSTTRSPGTPRQHKTPYRKSTQGTHGHATQLTRERVKADQKEQFGLTFEPDNWQAEVISHALHGYNGIFCAGTSCRKSLVFHSLPKLAGSNKVIVVICPLKL